MAVQVVDSLQKGHQAMVFVHSRKDTGKTARMLQMKAQQCGDIAHFDCREEEGWHFMQQEIDKSKNRHVKGTYAPRSSSYMLHSHVGWYGV